MQNISQKDHYGGLSGNKIKENDNKINDNTDEVKILELSNIIDKWEETVLFSKNGFYSFKNKEVKGKSKEFIGELEKLINTKTDEEEFSNEYAKQTALEIKNKKIKAIAEKMAVYEQQELTNWQNSVYSDAITSSINRAVLYKNDTDIVLSSLNNGLAVISLMAENEKWKQKKYNQKVSEYKSEFYYSLIKAFIADKDINAYKYYEQFKNYIDIDGRYETEQAIYKLKINIVAYNWAKEVFSYNLSKTELESEIKKIHDKDIEKEAVQYLKEFSERERKEKLQKEIQAEEKNWQEIISGINSGNVGLYIDYTLSKQHINAVKYYIEQFRKDGFIKTDKTKYMNLMYEMLSDFAKFKQKDITFYRAYFSEDDYKFFDNCRNMQYREYENMYYDYKYMMNILQKVNIDEDEDKYDFLKSVMKVIEEYKSNNNKSPEIREKNKLIEVITERFKKNKEDKNDGTSDKTGK